MPRPASGRRAPGRTRPSRAPRTTNGADVALTRPRDRGPRPGVVLLASGKSTPADYERPQHVDAAVVAGIADWLVPGRGRGPIARLFSGLGRFHRLCGGRLR
jgi:hypothetical protein